MASLPPQISYLDAIALGDAKGMYNLGWMIYNGSGVTQNSAEGIRWLKKAADKGNASAKKALADVGERYP